MIYADEIKYSKIGINTYNVKFQGALIGVVWYTPKGNSPWTFNSSREKAETFGSTRLQAVGYYIEKFWEGERT